jgi:hypothetical protein
MKYNIDVSALYTLLDKIQAEYFRTIEKENENG